VLERPAMAGRRAAYPRKQHSCRTEGTVPLLEIVSKCSPGATASVNVAHPPSAARRMTSSRYWDEKARKIHGVRSRLQHLCANGSAGIA
jgi:hypothetical protein